jgi:hypothetical protein
LYTFCASTARTIGAIAMGRGFDARGR